MSNTQEKHTSRPASVKDNKKASFIMENQKSLGFIVGGIVVLILLYFGYQQFYLGPRAEKAATEIYKAQQYVEVDSLYTKAIDGDGSFAGFKEIAEEYNNTKSANVANAYLGGLYLRQGKYQEAIQALEKYSDTGSEILDPLVVGLLGDAHSELKDFKKAASYYKSAAEKSNNSFTTPLMLKKLGLVHEALNENQAALVAYKKILTDFPTSTEATLAQGLISRVEAKN